MGFWALLAAVAVPLLIVSIALGGWVYLVLVVPLAMLLGGWLIWGAGSERRSARVANSPEKPELLGPGGPDDPDR